jgi:ankyrin repeat protein
MRGKLDGMANQARRKFLTSGGALAAAVLAPADASAGEQGDLLDDFLAAAISGNAPTVNALLDRNNALLYARDRIGQSAYLLAAYAKRAEIIKIFESRNIVLDVYEAASTARIDRLKSLLRGCPGLLRSPNAAGDTPLHVAARAEQSIVIDNIIGYGPDFSITNPLQKQVTVAHLAVECPQAEPAEAMAFAILGNGANPNALTADGDTVLHCAARKGHVRVVKLILQKGGEPTLKNSKGQTPADVAGASNQRQAQQLRKSQLDTEGLLCQAVQLRPKLYRTHPR